MSKRFDTSALGQSETFVRDIGTDGAQKMPSGWWMLPFLLSGTMFWLWFIPVLTKTVI